MRSSIKKLTLYGTIFLSARMLIGATSTLFLVSKGISYYDIGLVKSSQAFILLIADFPIAYLSDKYGNHTAVRFATLFGAFWLLLTAFFDSFYILLLAESCNALSICLFGNSFDNLLVSNSKEQETEKTLGKFEKNSFFFMAVFAVAGSLFQLNSPLPWYIASFTLFFICALGGNLLVPAQKTQTASKTLNLNTIFSDMKMVFSSVIKTPVVFHSILMSIILSVFYQTLIQFWQLLLKDFHSLSQYGFFYGLVFFCILIVQSLAGNYIAKQNKKKDMLILAFSFFGAFLGILGFVFSRTQSILLILALISFFFIMRSLTILIDSCIIDGADPNFRTSVLSVKSTMSRKFTIILLPIFGGLIMRFGAEFLFCFSFFIFTIIFIKQLNSINKEEHQWFFQKKSPTRL